MTEIDGEVDGEWWVFIGHWGIGWGHPALNMVVDGWELGRDVLVEWIRHDYLDDEEGVGCSVCRAAAEVAVAALMGAVPGSRVFTSVDRDDYVLVEGSFVVAIG